MRRRIQRVLLNTKTFNMKHYLLLIASLTLASLSIGTYGQQCGDRILDPQIAGFLKIIGYKDLTLEQLRSLPIEQIKYPQVPIVAYPK